MKHQLFCKLPRYICCRDVIIYLRIKLKIHISISVYIQNVSYKITLQKSLQLKKPFQQLPFNVRLCMFLMNPFKIHWPYFKSFTSIWWWWNCSWNISVLPDFVGPFAYGYIFLHEKKRNQSYPADTLQMYWNCVPKIPTGHANLVFWKIA